mmetsp:Transcript_8303/g.51740  ORF Transcript_8303/g.51740 Transcript_8303/m.51740 type:complete len:83 (-) Transcript_8303:1768-2016(-)
MGINRIAKCRMIARGRQPKVSGSKASALTNTILSHQDRIRRPHPHASDARRVEVAMGHVYMQGTAPVSRLTKALIFSNKIGE